MKISERQLMMLIRTLRLLSDHLNVSLTSEGREDVKELLREIEDQQSEELKELDGET